MEQTRVFTECAPLPADYKVHWYTIKNILGKGGFGITYLANDNNLDRDVAVKEFLPRTMASRNPDYTVQSLNDDVKESFEWGLDRFIREAKTLSKFNHPNIVRVHSVFEENNTAYMVMSYEHGMSFHERLIKGKRPSEDELLDIILPLLDGLEVMHNEGFIHRDIKPGNIFIRENGEPVLLDFGSARQTEEDETKTLTMIVTPGYAPFEQYYGKSDVQGPWTDIYSLGATAYRAIVGDPPTDATFQSRSSEQASVEMWDKLDKHSDEYSIFFLRAIEHALRSNFKDRPQNVDEWRKMLSDPSVSTQTQWRLAAQSTGSRFPSPKTKIKKSLKIPIIIISVIAITALISAITYFNYY